MVGVSVILPFYNEAQTAHSTVNELVRALRSSQWQCEIVCVENGSTDDTARELELLATEYPEVSIVTVPVNRGYGFGVRAGLEAARGLVVGYTDGDGQVSGADVVRVLDEMRVARAAKATRVRRADGPWRSVTSRCFNMLFLAMFLIRARDINAKPKFMRRDDLRLLKISSDDWFIDAEVMVRSARAGIVWTEVPVSFSKRRAGRSHIRWRAIAEFLKNMILWRIKRY